MQYFFFFVLQNVVNIFVFVGSVVSYECLTKTVSNMVNLVRPVKIYTAVCACWKIVCEPDRESRPKIKDQGAETKG